MTVVSPRIPRIALGAWDWRHPAWEGRFYAEDLPREWYLTFYSNEFDAVGLSASAWLNVELAELAQWVEDTHANFRFHLVMPAFVLNAEDNMLANISERLSILQPRLGSLLMSAASETCLSLLSMIVAEDTPIYGLHAGRSVRQVMPDFSLVMDEGTAPLVLLGEEPPSMDDENGLRSRQRRLRAGLDALAMRRNATILVQDDAVVMLERLMMLRAMRKLLGWQ
jgi:hypothetical protein